MPKQDPTKLSEPTIEQLKEADRLAQEQAQKEYQLRVEEFNRQMAVIEKFNNRIKEAQHEAMRAGYIVTEYAGADDQTGAIVVRKSCRKITAEELEGLKGVLYPSAPENPVKNVESPKA